jgi:hypothetical protein
MQHIPWLHHHADREQVLAEEQQRQREEYERAVARIAEAPRWRDDERARHDGLTS